VYTPRGGLVGEQVWRARKVIRVAVRGSARDMSRRSRDIREP